LGFGLLIWKYHDHEKPHTTDLDLPGVATLAVACGSLMSLVSAMGFDGFIWIHGVFLLAVAIVSGIWFVRIERSAVNPIFPPSFIMNRAIGPALIGSGLMGIAFFGVETYVPFYVQGTTMSGPKAAAGVITPVMLSWAISGVVAAPMIVRFGFRRTAIVGSVLTAISFTGLWIGAILHVHGAILAAVLAVGGLGFGSASMPYLLSAQHGVGWQQRGIVTSAIQFSRTMVGAIGIGLLGMLFNVLAAPQMEVLRKMNVKPAEIMDPQKSAALPEAAKPIILSMIGSSLTWVFAAMLVFAVIQIGVSMLMPKADDHGGGEKIDPMEALPG
jgi:hypothetical protein